jgi:NADH-quinone oxidoreductase subunit G
MSGKTNGQVTLTIDGQQISVPKGTTVLQAATLLGIDIPIFCAHEKLVPAGLCRMCLVEVERYPKLQTSCTLQATEGMVVHTDTDEVLLARRQMIEFLLINHPLDCPICDKGGECPLQDLTMDHGAGKSRVPPAWKRHWDKPIGLGRHIVLDRERCIQCARCVRFCEEIAHHPVLGFRERTWQLEIHTTSDPPFDSQFSGNTVDICPVGALTSRQYRFRARPWDYADQPSVCALCGCGCNISLQRRHAVLLRMLPERNESINEIWLCDRGRFGGVDEVMSPDRLLQPRVRENGEVKSVSWEEAFVVAGDILRGAKQDGGPIVLLASPRSTNEEVAKARELAAALGGTLCASPFDALLHEAVERGLCNARIADIDLADGILVLCADISRDLPIVDLKLKKAVRHHGAKLAVVHPQETEMDRHAVEAIRDGPAAWPKALAALGKPEGLVVILGSDGVATPGALLDDLARMLEERPSAKLLCVAPEANSYGLARAGLRGASVPLGSTVVSLGAEAPDAAGKLIYLGYLDSPTAGRADVVLAGTSFAEKEGTIVNTEGVEQALHRAIPPRGDARDDVAVLGDLIARLP